MYCPRLDFTDHYCLVNKGNISVSQFWHVADCQSTFAKIDWPWLT